MKASGYSGTPLARKLGIKSNTRLRLVNQPDHYYDLFTDMPPDIRLVKGGKTKKDLIHYFTTNASRLGKEIRAARSGFHGRRNQRM